MLSVIVSESGGVGAVSIEVAAKTHRWHFLSLSSTSEKTGGIPIRPILAVRFLALNFNRNIVVLYSDVRTSARACKRQDSRTLGVIAETRKSPYGGLRRLWCFA